MKPLLRSILLVFIMVFCLRLSAQKDLVKPKYYVIVNYGKSKPAKALLYDVTDSTVVHEHYYAISGTFIDTVAVLQ
ncbi:MAG: hypothetical protein H0W62_13110 [Chitinophagales bacterium]|nr:hypothetical protein [Chitinophagales bacterium]